MAHIINNAATDAIKNGQSAIVGDSVLAGRFCNFLILGCCRVDDFVTGEVEGNGGVCGDGDILRGISRQLDSDGSTISQIIQRAQVGEGTAVYNTRLFVSSVFNTVIVDVSELNVPLLTVILESFVKAG